MLQVMTNHNTNTGDEELQAETMSAWHISTLVVFTAAWSMSNRRLYFVLRGITERFRGQLNLKKVDVDRSPSVGFWNSIPSVPTILCLIEGRECFRIVGPTDSQTILNKLKPYMVTV